jgi:hypothetical protein
MGKPHYLEERLAKERAAKLKKLAEYRRAKVYGRRNEPAPPESPSTSVRAVPGSFEGSRRRH